MENIEIITIILGVIVILFTINLFTKKKKKDTLSSFFQGHVNDSYLSTLDQYENKIDLSGTEKIVTVMFTDIRGFTALSERLSNKSLFKTLNFHLNEISKIIVKNGGTIDKFLGDGTMAFWGAPLHDKYQASNALRAAFEIKQYFDTTDLAIGIGINTGPAIMGQVGQEKMRSYTAIGDTVNLSARIESLNKLYGSNILISNNTYKRFKTEPSKKRPNIYINEIDKVKVYGKRKSTVLLELVDLKENITNELKEGYSWFEMGLNAYRNGYWHKAEQYFTLAKKRIPNDKLCKTYIDRCKEFSISPPVGRWDGAISLSKL